MVKLFENALYRTLYNTRRLPSLIELRTFFSDPIRIVNNRLLTTRSDRTNNLSMIIPSSFLGKTLSLNTPVGSFHDKRDLRKDYIYIATSSHRFWVRVDEILPSDRTGPKQMEGSAKKFSSGAAGFSW